MIPCRMYSAHSTSGGPVAGARKVKEVAVEVRREPEVDGARAHREDLPDVLEEG